MMVIFSDDFLYSIEIFIIYNMKYPLKHEREGLYFIAQKYTKKIYKEKNRCNVIVKLVA